MQCNFKVGQRVICHNGIWQEPKYPDTILPEHGKVYTIREIVAYSEGVGLRLDEIVNRVEALSTGPLGSIVMAELSFLHTAFRALDEIDISVFTNMLKAKPKGSLKERANALTRKRDHVPTP